MIPLEQLVRVREVYNDGTALVMHIRESACSGDCHKCSGCGAAKEAILLKAENPIGARPGNLVNIHSASGSVLKAAAILYMLPLGLFFLGYLLGALAWQRGGICGILGFGLGVLLAVGYDRKVGKKEKAQYTITGLAGDSLLESYKKGDNDLG